MSGRIVHANASVAPATTYSGAYAPLGDSIGVSIDVTLAAGTLDVSVEWSPDGTNFGAADNSADSLAQLSALKAQGTLTIAEPVTTTDQFTIGLIEYTLLTTPVAAYDIAIGVNEAATKVNIVAAINASGTPGTEYFAGTLINPLVVATTFATDDCVLTARATGIAGNSIVSEETGNELTHAENIFDATTLGTTTAATQAVASKYFTAKAPFYRLKYVVATGAVTFTAAVNQ